MSLARMHSRHALSHQAVARISVPSWNDVFSVMWFVRPGQNLCYGYKSANDIGGSNQQGQLARTWLEDSKNVHGRWPSGYPW